MIAFGNLSKNRSVGEDLYKCKRVRLLQVHSYWGEGGGRWMCLEGNCSKLYSYSKKNKTKKTPKNQKTRLQCATKIGREVRIFIMSFRSKMEFKEYLGPISLWLHTPIISWLIEKKNIVMITFNIFTLINTIWLILL